MASSQTIPDILTARVSGEVAHPCRSNVFALRDGTAIKDPDYVQRVKADIETDSDRSASVIERELYPPPSEDELRSLRKVISDTIPPVAWLLCIVDFAERASYYGVKAVFSNFMQFPLPNGGDGGGAPPRGTQKTAGALGKGITFAVALVLVFQFLAYTIPIFGAWIADVKFGRLRVILVGVLLGGLAHIILVCGAIPSVLQAGNGTPPFLVGFVLLAFGAGLFKPNVAPLVLDQYKHQKPYVKTLTSGERCVVDPESTIQNTMLWFYLFVNFGGFYQLATVYSEKYIGFWLAFLTPAILYIGLPFVLWYLWGKLLVVQPSGSPLVKFLRIVGTALKRSKGAIWKKNFWDGAKPSNIQGSVGWTDRDVEDAYRTLSACTIFVYFPIYNLNDGGVGSVATSQGAALTTNGVPNDLLNNFNPIVILFAIPFLSHVLYPFLRSHNIKFGPIARITTGFISSILAGIVGTVLQRYIYKMSPCGYSASECNIGTGVAPISIWWQVLLYGFGGLSECFCNVTAYELAYARSPQGMKSLTVALFLFNQAIAAALSLLLAPMIKDPYLEWIWGAPAVALAVQTVWFYWWHRGMDDEEFIFDEAKEGRARESAGEEKCVGGGKGGDAGTGQRRVPDVVEESAASLSSSSFSAREEARPPSFPPGDGVELVERRLRT